MSRKRKKKINWGKLIRRFIIMVAVAALLFVVCYLRGNTFFVDSDIEQVSRSAAPAAVISASVPVSAVSEVSVPSTPEPTPVPTPEPTPEPQPEYFTLSFIGDNTLWANNNFVYSEYGLPVMVGDNFSYPYSNTVSYFENDEFTLANLECSFSDEKLPYDYTATTFPFLARTDYAQILTSGGVDFVTMANNHTLDFFQTGVESTQKVLEQYGMPYGYENQGQIMTTKNGLKLGIWTAGNDLLPNRDKAAQGIADLKAQGADLVICMFHWGQELYYSPNDNQTALAHMCIEAGADIVYGTHPHCLQPIEIYNGKPILYSVGNWVFGGNTEPSDPDTAIIQITIKRDLDGSISYEGFEAIPCCVSSNIEGGNAKAGDGNGNPLAYNNYCPTPYEPGSVGYERAMSKLNGTFQAKSQGADYSAYYASWG